MASNAPWSVKGIDPKAREAAKALARRSGLTLGEWLSRRIGEDFDDLEILPRGGPAENLEHLAARIEAAEQRSTLAVSGVDQAVRGALARLESIEREQVSLGARFEGALQEQADDQTRLAGKIHKLEEQTGAASSPEAFRALEASIGRIANQVYDSDGRARDSVQDLRRDLNALTNRIQSGQTESGEDLLARLAERIDTAEARTAQALRSLESSFSQLDRRLASAEERLDGADGPISAAVEKRLGDIAANLAQGVEAARTEMAEQLRASADGRFDRLEQALSEMSETVEGAEQRSVHAVDRMGHEVLRVAEALNHKITKVEQRSADAIEQVGGEVARAMGSLDTRLARTESTQVQALERLSGEIARISERLTERIGQAERRAAQSIDDVGEQVARVTERLNQRQERSSSDLAERIRQSEERTARLLEDAKERIDRRLADVRHRAGEPPAYRHERFGEFDAPAFPAEPRAFAVTGPGGAPLYPDVAPFGQAFPPAGYTPVETIFEPADIEAAQNFPQPAEAQSEADFVDEPAPFPAAAAPPPAIEPAPEPELESEPEPVFSAGFNVAEDEADDDEPEAQDDTPLYVARAAPPPAREPEEPPRALSTRELIEQARAAARTAALTGSRVNRAESSVRRPEVGAYLSGGGHAARRGETRAKRRQGNKALLVASFALAAVTLTGAGLVYTIGGESVLPSQLAAYFGDRSASQTAPIEAGPRLAVALDPRPIDETAEGLEAEAAAAAPPPADAVIPADGQPSAAETFRAARARVEAGESGGLEGVRRAANLGHAPAQAYLGGLYKNGRAGLAANPAEARRWYERAATSGDRSAMYQTGLLHYYGQGGPQNLTSAAQWFRRAADLGLTDAQYNLGILYEEGQGVGKNPAEAYKWYLLAARDTDPAKRSEARAAAERIKGEVSLEAQQAAERIVAGYTPQTPNASAAVSIGTIDIAETQRTLTRMGYFRGDADGLITADLREALRQFQRAQGLTATGNLDAATAGKLQTYNR